MASLRVLWFIFGVYFAQTAYAVAPVKELNDGNKIPILALGTGAGVRQTKGAVLEEISNAVYSAIEAGYRHIDTAAIYNDEREVGQGIAEAISKGLVKREDLFITTKLYNDKHRRNQVVPALRESLGKLGLDYVDLYLVHFPIAIKDDELPDDVDYLETWQGMEEAKELGLAKSIGVGNFNVTQLDRLIANCKVKPAVNQFEANPSFYPDNLIAHCKKLGIVMMAYSPFGYMYEANNEDTPPKEDEPTLVEYAKSYNKKVPQIVLRYLIDQDLIPVVFTTDKTHIKENIDIFDFKLNKDEIYVISLFAGDERLFPHNGWKRYPNYPFEIKEGGDTKTTNVHDKEQRQKLKTE